MIKINNFDRQVMEEQKTYYYETLTDRLSFEDLTKEEIEEMKKDTKRNDGYYSHENKYYYIANDFFTTIMVVKKVEKM